jgi:hypothetical protein
MTRAAVLVAGILLLAGCIGTVDRSEFDEEIQSRGGGFDQSLVIDAVDGVAAKVGTHDFEVTHLTASPESAVVTMEVRDPRNPDQLDDFTFRNGSLESVEPVQVAATDELDAEAFPISEFALDSLNDMADEALDEYDTEGGYVETVAFSGIASPEPPGETTGTVRITLESPRSSASAVFTPGGDLVSLELQ